MKEGRGRWGCLTTTIVFNKLSCLLKNSLNY